MVWKKTSPDTIQSIIWHTKTKVHTYWSYWKDCATWDAFEPRKKGDQLAMDFQKKGRNNWFMDSGSRFRKIDGCWMINFNQPQQVKHCFVKHCFVACQTGRWFPMVPDGSRWFPGPRRWAPAAVVRCHPAWDTWDSGDWHLGPPSSQTFCIIDTEDSTINGTTFLARTAGFSAAQKQLDVPYVLCWGCSIRFSFDRVW